MNARPRVLLIGRHFWPHGSIDSAGFLLQFADGMHRHGAAVEVMTPRYASSWPQELTIREIPVHRPAAAPRSDWSVGRYLRHVTTWLRQHCDSADVIFCDAIREEAMAAIEASRHSGSRTVVRASGWGTGSDPLWWRTSRSARKCGTVARMADAVIAPSAECQRALITDGFPASRIHRIDNGFAARRIPSALARQAARKALGGMNHDLAAPDDTPVVLCCCRMTRESGALLLVQAARHLITRYPNLRLWFIGDGPHRDWIYESLRGDGVRASIAMPGSFNDMEELFEAADIYLQSDEEGLDFFLPSAIAAAVPVVAIDNASTRAVIPETSGAAHDKEPGPLVEWFSETTAKSVRIAISRVLDDLPERRTAAARLRGLSLRTRPQSKTIKDHLDLIARLTREINSDRRPSVEAAS